jgi:hypothetical protein
VSPLGNLSLNNTAYSVLKTPKSEGPQFKGLKFFYNAEALPSVNPGEVLVTLRFPFNAGNDLFCLLNNQKSSEDAKKIQEAFNGNSPYLTLYLPPITIKDDALDNSKSDIKTLFSGYFHGIAKLFTHYYYSLKTSAFPPTEAFDTEATIKSRLTSLLGLIHPEKSADWIQDTVDTLAVILKHKSASKVQEDIMEAYLNSLDQTEQESAV